MTFRRGAAAAVFCLVLVLGAAGAQGSGFGFGCEITSLDVTGTIARVPVALGAGADELLAMLADQGLPPATLSGIGAEFDEAIADLALGLEAIPPLLPAPLLGGRIEVSLPLFVIDGLELSGGILNGSLLTGLADLMGLQLWHPLLDTAYDIGGETARLVVDADLAVWTLALDAVKRFDVALAGLQVSGGLSYTSGVVTTDVECEVPAGWETGIGSALGELHLDDIRWAALAAQAGVRLEVGLPFFRLAVEARLVQPIVEWDGWWDLRVGGWAGSVGVVIRF